MNSRQQLLDYMRTQYDPRYGDAALLAVPWRSLGLESMQWMDLVFQMEHHYGLAIPDAVIGAVVTLDELCQYVDAARGDRA